MLYGAIVHHSGPPTYGSGACQMQILTPTWQKFLRLVAGFFLSRDLAFVRKLCITRRSGSNPCNTRLFLFFEAYDRFGLLPELWAGNKSPVQALAQNLTATSLTQQRELEMFLSLISGSPVARVTSTRTSI